MLCRWAVLPRSAARRWAGDVAARASGDAAVTVAYQTRVAAGRVREDAVQAALARRFDALLQELRVWEQEEAARRAAAAERERQQQARQECVAEDAAGGETADEGGDEAPASAVLSPPAPRGLYIHGSVGIGKTMVMDMFFASCGDAAGVARTRRRVHFHEFMLDVHRRVHVARKATADGRDAVVRVADAIAEEAQLLCFDEFQVTDIADALIVKRLFQYLFKRGVVLVATSNRAPEALYDGGFNRQLFTGFIDTIREQCEVVFMDAAHDYRTEHLTAVKDFVPRDYYFPADGHAATMGLQQAFLEASTTGGGGAAAEAAANGDLRLPLPQQGRYVTVRRARGRCAWFGFEELCAAALSAADYFCLAAHFNVVIVQGVPQLGAKHHDEARRFVTLIDALYEKRCRLVVAADAPLPDLFQAFEAKVVFQGSDEETFPYSPPPVDPEAAPTDPANHTEMWVSTSGGASSSNSTTMLQTKHGAMEWSATGMVGVSLAQLSAVKDVAFSFRRAASRLAEMNRPEWGE
eukprot:TRINITY_DN18673_c0_g1_i1.p1 TRINITY_DN18673_c0_g1~~TRINITY_DN18673_c0_g1_i1.p1  ORF type:complete len:523 (+),score=175.93 TRINITY_DN18673_c0_g1_i1:69-1637(+)